MHKVAMAATVLSFALVGSASAQQVIATDPFTGAVTGANAAAAQGAAAAGPLGALVAAPLGLAAGAVTGTLGAVGTVVGAVTGTPTYYRAAPAGYYYAPAGSYPVQQAYYPASAGYPRQGSPTPSQPRQASPTASLRRRRWCMSRHDGRSRVWLTPIRVRRSGSGWPIAPPRPTGVPPSALSLPSSAIGERSAIGRLGSAPGRSRRAWLQ